MLDRRLYVIVKELESTSAPILWESHILHLSQEGRVRLNTARAAGWTTSKDLMETGLIGGPSSPGFTLLSGSMLQEPHDRTASIILPQQIEDRLDIRKFPVPCVFFLLFRHLLGTSRFLDKLSIDCTLSMDPLDVEFILRIGLKQLDECVHVSRIGCILALYLLVLGM